MKTLILSDLHANIYALEAIWAREKDCDLILCAGDLVDYGPFPRETLAWVREHEVVCVQGNHDARVALNYRQGNTLETVAPEERLWVHLNAGLLSEDEVRFLENLPIARTVALDGQLYGLTHLFKDCDEIVSLHAFRQFCKETFDHAAPGEINRLILGHTHHQAVRYLSDDCLWLNPGSTSYRRTDDPDPSAHYATIVDGRISLKRLDYDRTPLFRFLQGVRLKEWEMKVAHFFFGPREG
jgi:predicted phosphodiesterase